MNAYTTPVITALILFPFLAALAIFPYGILQYRKYGSISKGKLLILFSFIFYLLCAYFLVILPLPDPAEVAKLTTISYNVVPFTALRGFLQQTVLQPFDPSTYLPALKQNVFLQPFFNLMLTLPFGFYLRYIWQVSLKKVILASFALSLFFELTQLSGLYFIYPRSYRLFDVDDLILNTTGGVLGYLLTPALAWLLPTMTKLNEKAKKDWNEAGFSRRMLALLVDFMLFNLLFGVVTHFVPQLSLANYSVYLGGIFLYFVLLPYLWNGATIGKELVKIRMVKVDGGKAGFVALLCRQFLLFGVLLAAVRYFLPAIVRQMQADQGRHSEFYLLVFGALGVFLLLFLVDLVVLMFHKDHRLFYERVTKLKEVGF